jgi:REP element-mobilizing transposase RayT
MTRRARIESETGIYHVMLRGINKQNIFEYSEDYERFKSCLFDAKEKSGIKLFGYCLMNNHVHILIGIGPEPIGAVFKRVGVKYAYWYNKKYERQGPLFQDRFKSEPVLDDIHLLSVLRYIHQNPVKAGICSDILDYEWSSYRDYTGEGAGLIDTDTVLGIISKNPADQVRLFKDFTYEESLGVFADIDNVTRPTDESLRERVIEICGAKTPGEFQDMPIDERTLAIRAMRDSGMSIRQIVRLTGLPFGVVRNVKSV